MPAAGPIAMFSALEPELAALRAELERGAGVALGAGSRAWRGQLEFRRFVVDASANGARVVRHPLPVL